MARVGIKASILVFFKIGLLSAAPITVADVGGFGGDSAVAFSINNNGVVTGWALTPTGAAHAFREGLTGDPTDLNQSANESYAYAGNTAGTVAGVTYVDGQSRATVWSGYGSTDLGAGAATDVNAVGQVVGGNGQAFLYADGVLRELGTLPGGNWSSAYGLNDDGAIVGYGNVSGGGFRGFVYSSDTGLLFLGTLGGNNSYATAINNAGQIAGFASTTDGNEHAFITAEGAPLMDIGTLGGSSSFAYGINDIGAVVGYSWVVDNSAQHAFLYYNGILRDLNSVISANSGWVLNQAYGINDEGDIVGSGTYQGQTRAFLIDPVTFNSSPTSTPEPPTLGMIAIGLVVSALLRSRAAKRAKNVKGPRGRSSYLSTIALYQKNRVAAGR